MIGADAAKNRSYRNLVNEIESAFESTRSRHAEKMECKSGCSSCCKPDLTVGEFEAKLLKRQLLARPELIEKLRKLEVEDPHLGARCRFLSAKGECEIYEIRPVMCRAFGVPWKYKLADDKEQRGVCEKNFKTVTLESLLDIDLLDINHPARVLAEIDTPHLKQTKATRSRLILSHLIG